MGRYSGPKGRVNRRLGALVFENAGAARALEKRPNPPGMAMTSPFVGSFWKSRRRFAAIFSRPEPWHMFH